ncbi:uncharacterized protein cep295 isoform X2 [Syngnathoides biaculeatus]|uniref:uncharacterized protein cep295 isoform X2 n=1 Tax=Syngnathoides biaculeatus TaxID=300417 RepID=UPI002ADD8CEE|nr:uncharacterized protein cep295 isoform X2 [Syngnathoides biaculeatus]
MARRLRKLRLSPNEEAQLIQEERARRRKLRIQQVREQHKDFALQTRQNVEQRRQRELELLGQELREEWEQQRSEKLHMLQMLYEQSLQMVGHGQRMAKENEPDLAALAQREAQNHAKAEERFREALKELKSQRIKDTEMQSRAINARKKALQVEKERSAKVANLPVPTPKPILQATDSEKMHVRRKSDISAFAFTHYHMATATVDRAVDMQQTDAHEEAELEMKRLQDFQRDDERKRAERLETARLRGKSALKKEHLALDRVRLLVELEHMQQADMLRRRQQAFQMPPQIFQPPHRRQEMKEDFQRDMEFAFENMYTRERKIKGDLVGRLVSEPLPDTSTSSQDPELDERNASEIEKSQVDPDSQDSARVDTIRAAPRQALKKLLNRIRNQRSESTSFKNGVPAARSLVTVASQVSERDREVIPEWDTDVIPERDTIVRPEGVDADSEAVSERDMTIDTGSFSSQPTQPPLSCTAKPISQPIVVDAQHQEALSSKILELEMERKKRELELEREKQQQMALLRELEEEKAQLERLLHDIQQEGYHPKVAVTQEVPLKQAEVPPVHDQDVARGRLLLTAEHTRRIRECQERLLEQNRINQQSMEVARRRLEKYQGALQIHHKAAIATPSLPQLPSLEPQIAPEVTSRGSEAPTFPPTLPSTSFSLPSTLLPAELFGSSNLPIHQLEGVSDPALSGQNLASRVVDRGRSPMGTAESLPSKAVIRKICPKVVTRELLPREVIIKEVFPLKIVTREPSPPEVVSGESISHKRVTTESFPPQVVMRERLSPKMFTRESILPQVNTTESLPPPVITGQPLPPKMVTTESLLPPQLVTTESFHPKAVTKEVLPSQAITKNTFAFKPVTTDFLPFKAITTSLPFQPIQTVTMGHPRLPQWPLAESPGDADLDRQRPQEINEQQQEVEVESLKELHLQQQQSLELLRQQKETLKALINVDAQLRPHSEVSIPHDPGQTRLELLSSLLKVIEKSKEGSLSRPRHLQVDDVPSLPVPSTSRAASLHAPARAAKPPVTRVRLGTMMREQHELSAIQEVETPVDTSQVTGPEDVFAVPQHTMDWSLQEPHDCSVATEATQQTPSVSSSKRSSTALCGDELLLRTGISPDSSQHGSCEPHSFEFGRRAHSFGRTPSIHRSLPDDSSSPREASQQYAQRPPDSDCLSITSLSTGSYSTSDPEPNAGKSQNLVAMETAEPGTSSLLGPTSSSPAPDQHLLISLFNDGNVQRIIDRFAKELDSSLSSPSKSSDSIGSVLEELHSSFSEPSSYKVSEVRGEDDEASHVTRPSQATHYSALLASLFNDGNVQNVINRFAKELDSSQSPTGKSTGKSQNLVAMETAEPGTSSLLGPTSSSPAPDQHYSALLISLFNDGNVQRIIDRFAKELDSSLSSPSKSSDSIGSVLEELHSSFSEPSSYKVSEVRGEDDEASHVTRPSQAAHYSALLASLFNDGNVQNVINRFAKELDSSQSPTGKSTDSEGSVLEEPHSSITDQSLQQVPGTRAEDEESSRVTLPFRDAHASDLKGQPITEQLSVCEGQDSFRPLMAQLADQSSYLLADHSDPTTERLVGQPTAQSSMIGQPPVPPPSAGWDLAQSRILEQGKREPCVVQMTSRTEQSWLEKSPEDSSMKPLVGELDVSSGQDSENSGERTCVELSIAEQATVPSEGSNHSASDSRPNPFPPHSLGEDSFLPLPAEVTRNETVDPSAVFQNATDSSDGHLSSGDLSVSVLSNSQAHSSTSESDHSTERFRAEDGSLKMSACHRVASPQAVQLLQLDVSEVSSTLSMLPEEEMEEQHEVRVLVSDLSATVQLEQSLNLRMDLTTKEAGNMKGILEQSQITLVSSTDTTLQDNILSEEEPLQEADGHEIQEESQTTIIEEELSGGLKVDQSPTHAGMLLEFNWGSQEQGVFEKKRRALQERSARRAEEVKAKGALARTAVAEVKVAAQSEERPPRNPRDVQLDTFKMANSTLVKQQKSSTPPAVMTSTMLNNQSQVKKSKRDVWEMHKRTERLYEQLEEVKQQKAVRSRQEAYANNRQKAKAFHMKTLQKLRAKQTQH